jgi:hypothetical protein
MLRRRLHDRVLIHCFWSVRKIAKKATISFVISVCMSVHMELGFHWTDFHEVWYFRIFRTSVEKIEVSLKCDKNNAYFTKAVKDTKTHILVSINFFPKIVAYMLMWKNTVQLDRPQVIIKHKTKKIGFACRIQTRNLNI